MEPRLPDRAPGQPLPTLLRVVGRWGLAALMLNTMIGASIFGLPSLIAARLGNLSPLAYLVGASAIAVIAACLSEVASQFSEGGGPYLYARAAFGRFAAIQIGWLTWLSRIAASSGVADLFMSYLGELVPVVKAPLPRVAILTVLVAFLAAVNYRGVTSGSRLSNLFTVTKLLLLVLFVAAGCAALLLHPVIRVTQSAIPTTRSDWFDAVILMIYAYGGFEAALVIAGEARNPRKDAPAALLIALSTATLLYILIQYVVIHTVPNAAATTTPALDAARRFLGPSAIWLVGAGILFSAYGYLSANMLHVPRLTFAMAVQGDFPRAFASVHPRFRTPAFSVVSYALLLLVFSSLGDFRWNAILSAMTRLFIYGSVAAALPALRRQSPRADAFRLPAGNLFALLALLITATLITRLHAGDLLVLTMTFGIAFLNWFWRRRPASASDTPNSR
jgi:basic amino acid/polyamine antiporter, APA family